MSRTFDDSWKFHFHSSSDDLVLLTAVWIHNIYRQEIHFPYTHSAMDLRMGISSKIRSIVFLFCWSTYTLWLHNLAVTVKSQRTPFFSSWQQRHITQFNERLVLKGKDNLKYTWMKIHHLNQVTFIPLIWINNTDSKTKVIRLAVMYSPFVAWQGRDHKSTVIHKELWRRKLHMNLKPITLK